MTNKTLLLRIRQLLWVGLLLATAIFVMSAVQRRKVMPSEDIKVNIAPLEGADSTLITERDVKDLLQKSFEINILGSDLGDIDVGRVERVLERNAFVKNADVFIDSRNVINTEITQRKPIMRIMDSDGRSYYLDATGYYMPLSEHYAARVIVGTGFIPPHVPDFLDRKSYGLKNVFELVKLIQTQPFYDRLIEQIHVTQNGDILLIPKLGKQQILFGKYREAAEKLKRLKIFYEEALPYEGWDKYKLIDIRFEDQIVCQK